MSYEVDKVDAMTIKSKNMIRALFFTFGDSFHSKETGSE